MIETRKYSPSIQFCTWEIFVKNNKEEEEKMGKTEGRRNSHFLKKNT